MLEASSTVHPQHSKPTSTFYGEGANGEEP